MFEGEHPPAQETKLQEETRMEILPGYTSFVPGGFQAAPFEYFEMQGTNIKPGQVEHNEQGAVKEDPTAVKDFPVWTNADGKELRVVAKKVNIKKGKVGKTKNPFHEIDMMERVRTFGLPAPAPIAKIQKGEQFLILMERVEGITLFDDALESGFAQWGYSEGDKQQLKQDAERAMTDLQGRFEKLGIKRKWKLSDMVFKVDFPEKKVVGITPVDWERTDTIASE